MKADLATKAIDNIIKAKGNGDDKEKNKLKAYKRAILPVQPSIFFSFLRNGDRHFSVTTGLPPDTKMIGAFYSHKDHNFDFVVESKEFEAIVEGAKLPILKDLSIQEYVCPYLGEDGTGLEELLSRITEVHLIFEKLEQDIYEEFGKAVDLSDIAQKVKNLLWRQIGVGDVGNNEAGNPE